jgi:hypothetical protein
MTLNRLCSLTAAVILIAVTSLPASSAQQASPASAPENKYVAPFYLDCGRDPAYKSQSARGRVLSSPDGSREAYAEAEARAKNGSCSNASSVFVQDEDGAYRLVFLQAATEDFPGNGVRLIDWSKDGQRLLFEVLRWQYGSDAAPQSDLWIYTRGILKAVPLRGVFGSSDGCNTTFEPLGFSAAGDVVMRLSAQQARDVDGEYVPKCEEKRGAWIFDPANNRMTQASYDYAVPKWGKLK